MHTKSTLKLVDALKHATSLHKHAPLPYRHHLATLFNFILFTSIKLYAFSNYYLTIMLVIRWNYSAFALLCIILCVCIIILPSMAMLKAAPLYRSGGGGAHCCGMIYALNDLWGTIWWLLRWWWCMNAHANHKLVLARSHETVQFILIDECEVQSQWKTAHVIIVVCNFFKSSSNCHRYQFISFESKINPTAVGFINVLLCCHFNWFLVDGSDQ